MKSCPACNAVYDDEVFFCAKDGTKLADSTLGHTDVKVGMVLDDRYRLEQFLGAGGMGEVYRAEHVYIHKTVAIKLLRPEITASPEAVQRFHLEARTASSIGHRNIVTIEDFGKLGNGVVYLAMEFLDGTPLNRLIAKGPLDNARALDLVVQIAEGLRAAHAREVIHRDMKPENVFILPGEAGGELVKILDFGIAKMNASGAEGANLTRTGAIFGTPHYMSPEQAMGTIVDRRADIYSVGVLMFEMFTGRVPFKAESFLGILTQHVYEQPPKPCSIRPDLPAVIEAIILKAMAKEPGKRQQDMDGLIAELLAARSVVTSGEPPALLRGDWPASAANLRLTGEPATDPPARDTADQPEPLTLQAHDTASQPAPLTLHAHDTVCQPEPLTLHAGPVAAGTVKPGTVKPDPQSPEGQHADATNTNTYTNTETATDTASGEAPSNSAEPPQLDHLKDLFHPAPSKAKRKEPEFNDAFLMIGVIVGLLLVGAGVLAFWRPWERSGDRPRTAVGPGPGNPGGGDPKYVYDCPDLQRPTSGFIAGSFGTIREDSRRAWDAECPEGSKCRLQSSPVVVHDTVLFGSYQNRVFAVDAGTLTRKWSAEVEGEVSASPLAWDDVVVVASKDKRIRVFATTDGTRLAEYDKAAEYFTAGPFFSVDSVWIPGWDHSFHRLERQGATRFLYTPKKVGVRGMIYHDPTVLNDRWYFAGTRILTRKDTQYNFYMPVDGRTLRTGDADKITFCVLAVDPAQITDKRVLANCEAPNILVDEMPTMRAWPPLVSGGQVWYFLYSETNRDGMVVLCDHEKSVCRRVMRTGLSGAPAAGIVAGKGRGFFATLNEGACHLCAFQLDQTPAVDAQDVTCLWKSEELPGCPGDLRLIGDRLVFGTDKAKLVVVDAVSGTILQKLKVGGAVSAAPAYCNGRLFVPTESNTLEAWDTK